MKKLHVYSDDSAIKKLEEAVVQIQPAMQAVVDEAAKLGVPVTNETFDNAVTDPETYAKNELTKDIEVSAGPFRMKREALIDALELPDMSGFLRAVRNYREKTESGRGAGAREVLEIDKDTVTVNQEKLEEAIDHFKKYLTTPEQIEVYKFLETFVDAFNKFNSRNGSLFTFDMLQRSVFKADGQLSPGQSRYTLVKHQAYAFIVYNIKPVNE